MMNAIEEEGVLETDEGGSSSAEEEWKEGTAGAECGHARLSGCVVCCLVLCWLVRL